MQAVREYRAINIVKDTFECALEGIIPKEGTIEQIETYGRTADMKESLELVKGTTSDIYKVSEQDAKFLAHIPLSQ